VLNEVVAFIDMAKLGKGQLSEVSSLIMMYALCGFANFSAVGIVIGGMGAMVPERRSEIVGLGLKSVIAGTLATCLSGTIMGLLSRLNLF
jgi:CNT family concentrative nucleoside transporter